MKAACVDNAAFIVQFSREQKCVVASDLKTWGEKLPERSSCRWKYIIKLQHNIYNIYILYVTYILYFILAYFQHNADVSLEKGCY